MSASKGRKLYAKSLPPIPEQPNDRMLSERTSVKPASSWRTRLESSESALKLENNRQKQTIVEKNNVIQKQLTQLEVLSTELYKERESSKLYKSLPKIALNSIQRIDNLLTAAIGDEVEEYMKALDSITTITQAKTKAVQEEINNFKEVFGIIGERRERALEMNNNEEVGDEDTYKEEEYTDEEIEDDEDYEGFGVKERTVEDKLGEIEIGLNSNFI